MANNLSMIADELLPSLDQEMKTVLQFDGERVNPFTGMMHYQMGWVDESLQPIAAQSGKRIRPLVCLLAEQAAGGKNRQAVPAAAAIEILHNFSLVHDDIEDASPLRRGRPTLWRLWGEPQAINSGDAMFARAHTALGRLLEKGVPPATVVLALRRFDQTCFALTAGQYADMDFEGRPNVTVDEYIEMITGKTAVLLSLSAELGALVANAPQEVVRHYAAFGLNLGLAFQVVDDILGIWGDESRTGKSAATDIVTKKKTLPVLYGLDKCQPLRELYATSQPDADFVSEAVGLLDEAGARQFASEKAGQYSQEALANLTAAKPQGAAGKALFELVDLLLMREM
ncbi:MAG: polyprenyl synthetase family protein [Candidatus Promineifilaceae bacterium]